MIVVKMKDFEVTQLLSGNAFIIHKGHSINELEYVVADFIRHKILVEHPWVYLRPVYNRTGLHVRNCLHGSGIIHRRICSGRLFRIGRALCIVFFFVSVLHFEINHGCKHDYQNN